VTTTVGGGNKKTEAPKIAEILATSDIEGIEGTFITLIK